ncbi:hypothetical protein [Phytoactinopolyspora endophytica]|uniref:hypothetical protein n=1 Tax=Phytoactinopolyspora endophytica TaxID=1642495 RepID=UPI00101C95C6|nr:hypothetical protein [Phytoactinopolyspora endophytica]
MSGGADPRAPRAAVAKGWAVTLVVAVMVGLAGAGLVTRAMDSDASGSGDTVGAAPADVVADGGEAEAVDGQDAIDLYAPGMVEALFERLGAEGVEGYLNVVVRPDRASFEVQTAPGARQYDEIAFNDGELGEPVPGGEIAESDELEDEVFAASDIAEGVVAAVTSQAADVAGLQGRQVSHVVIARDSSHRGVVTVTVHLESDDYGSSATLTWDGTGRHLLRDGS